MKYTEEYSESGETRYLRTRSSPRNKTIGRRFRKTDSKLTSDKQGKEANARRGEAEKGERGDTARRQRESQRRAG